MTHRPRIKVIPRAALFMPFDLWVLWGQGKPSYIHCIICQKGNQTTNLSRYIETYFSVSSSPQNQSKAIVCIRTPRMYPRSRYFLVTFKIILSFGYQNVKIKYCYRTLLNAPASSWKNGKNKGVCWNSRRLLMIPKRS